MIWKNYVECKCSVLQLKDRNQNRKKKKPKQIITICKKHTFKTKMQKSKKTEKICIRCKPQNKLATLKSDKADVRTRINIMVKDIHFIILFNVHIPSKNT